MARLSGNYSCRLIIVAATGFWVTCGASHGFFCCSIYFLVALVPFSKIKNTIFSALNTIQYYKGFDVEPYA